MIYCQDCGAANDRGNPTCRVCGQALQVHRSSTLRCSACGQFVGVGAAFCSSCGASAEDVALGPLAEGGAPLNEDAIDALLAAPAPATPRAATAPQPATESFDLGAGLELPDWLKRAAAQTRQAPTAAAAAPGFAARATAGAQAETGAALLGASATVATAEMAVGHGGAQTTARSAVPDTEHASIMNATAAPASPPLPPLPDGGLGTTMPSWLRPGTGPENAGAAQAPPAADAYASTLIPGRSLAEDPTDTTSFISENDLPEWLRQLATAEAAQAEETRLAEEEERITAEQEARAADRQAAIAASAASLSTPAQQETTATAASAGVAGSWLARRDATEETGRRSTFADLVQEQVTEQESIAETVTPVATRSIPDAELASTWAAVAPASPTASPSTTPERGDGKRWIVIGVLLVVIAALLAYLFVGGQLS